MKLLPLGDKILIERSEPLNKTKGGIFLPDGAKPKPTEGKVVAIGEGKTLENGIRISPKVKIGDGVLFSSYSGTDIKINDNDYVIMSESDILAIVEQ